LKVTPSTALKSPKYFLRSSASTANMATQARENADFLKMDSDPEEQRNSNRGIKPSCTRQDILSA
ncbi:MAG: hypothetical protein QW280_05210, partial [Candidatus Korarchaeum sp.]